MKSNRELLQNLEKKTESDNKKCSNPIPMSRAPRWGLLVGILLLFLIPPKMIAYDHPELYEQDDFLTQKVRDYNDRIGEIHDRIPIPLPFFGAPWYYGMVGDRKDSQEGKFITECIDRREESRPERRSSVPSHHWYCVKELNEWKGSLSERQNFNREFCKDPEELAYLDFLIFYNPLLDPYERCKNLRDSSVIQKDKDKIREEVSEILSPFPFPISYNASGEEKKAIDTKTQEHVSSLEKMMEKYIIRLGVMDAYTMNYPQDEWNGFFSKPWYEFTPTKNRLKLFEKSAENVKIEYARYLRSQIYINDESKNLFKIKETLNLSQKIKAFPEATKTQKKNLDQAEKCLIQLSKKNPKMSPGFYMGFYKKYSNKYDLDERFKESLPDPEYSKHFRILQKLHWRKYQGSVLFEKRLEFINDSCAKALRLKEDQLTLKYFLDIVISTDLKK